MVDFITKLTDHMIIISNQLFSQILVHNISTDVSFWFNKPFLFIYHERDLELLASNY